MCLYGAGRSPVGSGGGGCIKVRVQAGITVVCWMVGFHEIEAPISVHVICIHLYFYGFSNETIHVAGFCGEEFGFL